MTDVVTVSCFSVLGHCALFMSGKLSPVYFVHFKHFPILFEYVIHFLQKFTLELQQYKTKVANHADSCIRTPLHSDQRLALLVLLRHFVENLCFLSCSFLMGTPPQKKSAKWPLPETTLGGWNTVENEIVMWNKWCQIRQKVNGLLLVLYSRHSKNV